MITDLQKWRLLAKDKACVCFWIIYKTVEIVELFQALEDEASAKLEIKQKTKPYIKFLSFSQGADAELPQKSCSRRPNWNLVLCCILEMSIHYSGERDIFPK